MTSSSDSKVAKKSRSAKTTTENASVVDSVNRNVQNLSKQDLHFLPQLPLVSKIIPFSIDSLLSNKSKRIVTQERYEKLLPFSVNSILSNNHEETSRKKYEKSHPEKHLSNSLLPLYPNDYFHGSICSLLNSSNPITTCPLNPAYYVQWASLFGPTVAPSDYSSFTTHYSTPPITPTSALVGQKAASCSDEAVNLSFASSKLETFLHKADKGKRNRTIFTMQQLSRLEEEFTNKQYMVGSDRSNLAKELNLNESQVKVWFQNRRIKMRKQKLPNENNTFPQSDSSSNFKSTFFKLQKEAISSYYR